MNTIPNLPSDTETSPLDTICDLKWNYPIFNMDRGEFRSCCRTPSNKISDSELQEQGIDAFLNSPKLKQSRLDLINGIKTADCKSCWQIEDAGMKSPRHSSEQFWRHLRMRKHTDNVEYSEELLIAKLSTITDIDDPTLVSDKPYMLEISLGNTCDMKCMYCNHRYSTQWATEEIKLGRISQSQYDKEFPKAPKLFDEKFWEWFNAVGVKCTRIGIIGGEPLIMPEFYTFVEKLIEAKKNAPDSKPASLWIVTNMNTPKNYLDKFLKYLPRLSEAFNVEILVSMESVGKKSEYIRNGLDWDRFIENLDTVLSNKDLEFNFGFIPSLNILSVASLKEFIMFTEDLYRKYGRPVAVKHNIVSSPSQHSPFNLTPDFAKYIDECIAYMEPKVAEMPVVPDAFGRWDAFINFIRPLGESLRNNTTDRSEQQKEFAKWVDEFDKKRKINLLETFPEYTEFYNYCKTL